MGDLAVIEKVLDTYSDNLSETTREEILSLIKHSPRNIPFKEIFATNSQRPGISSNVIEFFIESRRKKVPDRYKSMFDTMCNPVFHRRLSDGKPQSLKAQLELCNKMMQLLIDRNNEIRKAYKKPLLEYEPYGLEELDEFKVYCQNNSNIRTAVNMALMHRDHADNFINDLADMRTKALAHEDPNKMKAYQETFMKISDFYMKQNMVYDQQRIKLDVQKFKHMARISASLRKNSQHPGKDQAKVIEISEENFERKDNAKPDD